MSFPVSGGFRGTDGLLAFAVEHSAQLNQIMGDEMEQSELRSEAAKALNSIKTHLDTHGNPEELKNLNEELRAFQETYGGVPELGSAVNTVRELHNVTNRQWGDYEKATQKPDTISGFGEATVKEYSERLTGDIDASGTNDQLAMIYIKSLNDRINNLSGTVSGIEDSRQRATEAIIGKFS